jgi:hypothetical protein
MMPRDKREKAARKLVEGLVSAITHARGEPDDKDEKLPPLREQRSLLKQFITHSLLAQSFTVGEEVTRTKKGEGRYKFPTKDQVAIIASVFTQPVLDEHGEVCHGELAVVFPCGHVKTYPVDFRLYQKTR